NQAGALAGSDESKLGQALAGSDEGKLAQVAHNVAKNGQKSRISRRNQRFSVVETLQPPAGQAIAAVFHAVLKAHDPDVVGARRPHTTNGQLRKLGLAT